MFCVFLVWVVVVVSYFGFSCVCMPVFVVLSERLLSVLGCVV